MSVPTFGAPTETQEEGDQYSLRNNVDHQLIIKARKYQTGVITKNSPDGTDAVRVDLVDLDDATGQYVYRNVPLFGGSVVDATKDHVGKDPILARIRMTTGKSGRDYPVLDPVTDPSRAVAYYQAKGDPFAQEFSAPTAAAPKQDPWASSGSNRNDDPPF